MKIPVVLYNFYYNLPPDATRIFNLQGSAIALFLSSHEGPFIAVEHEEEAGMRLYEDILFYNSLNTGASAKKKEEHPETEGSLFFLPDPDGAENSGKRSEVIYKLKKGDSVVTSVRGMDSPVWPQEALKKNSLRIVEGKATERDSVERRLVRLGYHRVSLVAEKGEYSMKGWLLDIYPSTAEAPVRIEFFGDEVESMRSFDIESQKSVNKVAELNILPADEPVDGHKISSVLEGAKIFQADSVKGQGGSSHNVIFLSAFDFRGEGHDAGLLHIRGLGIYPDERKSLHDISHAIKLLNKDNTIVIVSSSQGQAERIRDILFDGGVVAPIISAGEVIGYEGNIAITRGKLSAGLFLPGLLILTERELFGERPSYKPLKKSRISGLMTSIDDLVPGNYVVHKDHGIGRFISMQRQRTGNSESDLIVLEYKGGDKLYIPLYYIDRIKKYHATEDEALPLVDRLGGNAWSNRKEKVRKAVKEMADKLLRLYAEREIAKGFAFSRDTGLHREFYGFFPYEETPDQLRAIEEIEADMESERPMDRLLCGDVGYGKTEVAMRAAFKAVYDNKQVAVLVPTTILCEQHYLTFRDRFSAFPVKIDYLSRFKSKREQSLSLKALSRGETDIIIGTHGLLKKDLSFSNPGLFIIDEEHRFGVAQKERIKEITRGIDVLMMTATPIPRTLQMALSGIRPMSVIETAPEERLAVRSIVSVFSEDLIREAIERELQRGGQVLFVHNFILDIDKTADLIKRLVPKAGIAIGHGQMPEKRLEEVMLRFMRREIDVLVSTSIIGSGIDIPSANTIIINRADKMGLADLYQMRGRVGRSSLRAYSYFLIPGEDAVEGKAKKRLQAIREMSFLGAGFRLALKDMEIRGTGNLLGPQQSGHVHAVGFDMYVEMLENAVAELKGVEVKEEIEPAVSLDVSAFIPEDYIDDLPLRLNIYRRVANAKRDEDLEGIESEMADRFGDPPEPIMRLTDVMRLKLKAKKLRINSIKESAGKVRFVFSEDTPVAPEKVFALQGDFKSMRFYEDGFEINTETMAADKRQAEIHKALARIMPE